MCGKSTYCNVRFPFLPFFFMSPTLPLTHSCSAGSHTKGGTMFLPSPCALHSYLLFSMQTHTRRYHIVRLFSSSFLSSHISQASLSETLLHTYRQTYMKMKRGRCRHFFYLCGNSGQTEKHRYILHFMFTARVQK